jgi:hypothetical protein
MTGIPYDVYLNEELIDTIWFDESYKLEEVWSSLVNHDGYDSDIVVMKAL